MTLGGLTRHILRSKANGRVVSQKRIDEELEAAKALCEWLGYLPLGLELVGRYLSEHPTFSLARVQEELEGKRLEAQALCQDKGT